MPGGVRAARHVAFPLLVAGVLAAVADPVTAAFGAALAASASLAARRWVAARAAASARITLARIDLERAAARERARAVRELHDIAARHITNLIVHIGATAHRAAPRDVRPALELAAESARTALHAIDRFGELDPAVPTMSTVDSISHLADHARRMGGRVFVRVDGTGRELPAPVAGTIHGVVAEGLANALRHAPGAPVTVALRHSPRGVTVSVANEDAREPAARTGSTRLGLAGLRERVERLGGRLHAGPRARGGWLLFASIPVPPTVPARHRPAGDVLIAAAVAGYPLVTGIFAEGCSDTPPVFTQPASSAALVVFLLLRGIPLLWRRTAPVATLATGLAVMALWPLAVLAGLLPQASAWLAGLTVAADVVAVFAVGAYSRRRVAILAPVITAACTTAALTVGVAFDGSVGGQVVPARDVLTAALGLAGCVTVALYGVLALGLLVQTRRRRVRRREDRLLLWENARAAALAMAERASLARTVRARLAGRTRRLVSVAEAKLDGDAQLTDVSRAAGAVLEVMRQQLRELREDG